MVVVVPGFGVVGTVAPGAVVEGAGIPGIVVGGDVVDGVANVAPLANNVLAWRISSCAWETFV